MHGSQISSLPCLFRIVNVDQQRLYVCNNGLSAEAAELIGQLLQEDGVPPLKLLHFYNNMSGNGGAIAIANLVKLCPHIEDFRFSATRSMNEGCIAVAKVTIMDNNYEKCTTTLMLVFNRSYGKVP